MASQNRVERGDLNIPKAGEPDPTRGLPFMLSPARAAREIDYSRRHIYQLIADGKLPAERIGHSVRIRRSELMAFIARNHVEGER